MALSQLFWDVLMPWNLKSTYFSFKMIHFLSLNIWYVVFWIKYWNLKLPHHCILFLFTIYTVSQLFWNRVCNISPHFKFLLFNERFGFCDFFYKISKELSIQIHFRSLFWSYLPRIPIFLAIQTHAHSHTLGLSIDTNILYTQHGHGQIWMLYANICLLLLKGETILNIEQED